jgi:hypothetical protein
MLSAVQISVDQDGQLLLDPTQREQEVQSPFYWPCLSFVLSTVLSQDEVAGLAFAFAGEDEGAIMSICSGILSESAYLECLETAKKACARIRAFSELALRNRVSLH